MDARQITCTLIHANQTELDFLESSLSIAEIGLIRVQLKFSFEFVELDIFQEDTVGFLDTDDETGNPVKKTKPHEITVNKGVKRTQRKVYHSGLPAALVMIPGCQGRV